MCCESLCPVYLPYRFKMSAETLKRPVEGAEETHVLHADESVVASKKQKSAIRDEVRALTENEKSDFRYAE